MIAQSYTKSLKRKLPLLMVGIIDSKSSIVRQKGMALVRLANTPNVYFCYPQQAALKVLRSPIYYAAAGTYILKVCSQAGLQYGGLSFKRSTPVLLCWLNRSLFQRTLSYITKKWCQIFKPNSSSYPQTIGDLLWFLEMQPVQGTNGWIRNNTDTNVRRILWSCGIVAHFCTQTA